MVLLIIISIIWIILWYMAKPANDFCNSLNASDDLKLITLKANSFGYSLLKESGGLKVVTRQSSFMSFSCLISIEQGHITNKEVIIGD